MHAVRPQVALVEQGQEEVVSPMDPRSALDPRDPLGNGLVAMVACLQETISNYTTKCTGFLKAN